MKLLHIYAQAFWHESARIIGNRAALEALVTALQSAIEEKTDTTYAFEADAADGEGYECYVIRVEDEESWKALKLPYTDEIAQGGNVGKVAP